MREAKRWLLVFVLAALAVALVWWLGSPGGPIHTVFLP